MIDDNEPSTWRQGEEVEVALRTKRGPGNLIELPGRGGFIRADVFDSVCPVTGADPEHLRTIKTLRAEVVEERLAAAQARNDTTVAEHAARVADAHRQRALADMRAVEGRLRLAVAALERIRALDAAGPVGPLPFLDVLLPTEGLQGSLALPCNAELIVEREVPGEECPECFTVGEPTREEAARRPCMLPLGHEHVGDAARHRTLDGQEFERGETVRESEG
jgi:hypothetical protein